MLLSAVSFGLLFMSGPQVGGVAARDLRIADGIGASIVTLIEDGVPTGSAVLIDRSGLFVAHTNTVTTELVDGRLPSGSLFRLKLLARDGATQLALLKAATWEPESMRPLAPPNGDIPYGSSLILMFPSGAVSAQAYHEGVGVLSASRRLIPIREIRFEAPIQSVASALIFTRSGAFLGAVNATLSNPTQQNVQAYTSNSIQLKTLNQGPTPMAFGAGRGLLRNYGPATQTVAYVPGSDLVKKVVEGFRSPNHQVEHPWLGVMCVNAPDGGALVTRVVANSPAATGHVQPNDVIFQIGLVAVRNQVDFFKAMLRQRPGAKITLRLKREGKTVLSDVVIGEMRVQQ